MDPDELDRYEFDDEVLAELAVDLSSPDAQPQTHAIPEKGLSTTEENIRPQQQPEEPEQVNDQHELRFLH